MSLPLRAFAKKINDLRLSGLFGSGDDELPAMAETLNEEATQHFLIGLALLEQAERSIKLALITDNRKEK